MVVAKMPAQQLLLNWKDHNGALVSVFENLLKNNSLVDCTLAAEGQYLKAHKLVLSACSSYFELLFNQESEKNPIVILNGVKFTELESAVNFMYRGEVEVCGDRLAAFLEVADTLQIIGLGSNSCQFSRNKPESPAKSTEPSSPSQQFSRESRNNLNEIAVQDAKLDLTSNNESSSQIQQLERDALNSSQSLEVGSLLSLASTSGSVLPGRQSNMESSTSSQFPIVEIVPTDANTAIKLEPVTDAFFEENCDEMERDLEDVIMMEDEEAWNEPNPESVGDEQADDTHNEDYTDASIKSEGSPSENVEPLHAVDVPAADDYTDAAIKSEGSTSENVEPLHAVDVPAADEARCEIVKEEDGPSTWNPQPSADLGTETGWSEPETDDGEYRRAVQENRHPTRRRIPAATRGVSTKSKITEESCINARQYIRAVEIRRGRYSCRLCPEVFSESSQYETHRQQHAPGRRIKCMECSYATAYKSILKRHMRTHTGERPFKCQHCNFSSARKDTLVGHMRYHTGERSVKCQQCDFSSTRKRDLNRHMRTHTGERPFKCQQCDFSSAGKGDLNRHKRIHTGERPFKCQHCSYSSAVKNNLTSHMRIHTGEKPFKCQHCGYSFARRDSLIRHLRMYKCMRRYTCKICGIGFMQLLMLRDHISEVHVGFL